MDMGEGDQQGRAEQRYQSCSLSYKMLFVVSGVHILCGAQWLAHQTLN